MWPQDGVRGGIDLQTIFGEVIHGLDNVLIRHLRHRDLRIVREIVEREFGNARNRSRIELAGFGARALNEIGERGDLHRSRNANAENGAGETRHRHQIGRVVRELLILKRVDEETPTRPPQERVIVVGRQHGLNRDHAIPARTVLNHHRFAPACLQSVLNNARTDIGAGARTERNDEADRPLRPVRCLCACRRWRKREERDNRDKPGAELRHISRS